MVVTTVDVLDFPFNTTKSGDLVRMRGRISKVDPMTITLEETEFPAFRRPFDLSD